MRIRDALESDAEALAGLADRPEDVVIDMVHDRSVRVATDGREQSVDGREQSVDEQSDPDGRDSVAGFIAFDVRSETVHVTDFGGRADAIRRLFEEPRRFAIRESMDVEVVVAETEGDDIDVVEAVGFDRVGSGPRFDGRSTTRFRLEPTGTE